MKRTACLVGLLLVIVGAFASAASAQLAWDPKEFMGIDEVVPGMVGYGKTVFQGTKVETFDIEVVGVLKKIDFGFDMILIRVTSGPVVDRKLQTVSGMSGSPIYVNDRLIGAYAYGWDFQQEPIAGVTPIAAMLESTQPGSVTPPLVGSLAPRDRVLKIADKLFTRVQVAATTSDAQELQGKVDPTTMVLSPVATPLFANGLAQQSLKPLQKFFGRYNVRVEGGPGQIDGPTAPLEPGSAVAVSIMDGDANLSAVGTVTYVKGDKVLCFGHPFMGLGKIDLPMCGAYVHGIVNSSWSSFKMASPMGRVGTANSDRMFALGGVVGQTPSTLPVSLYMTDESRKFTRRYSVNLMDNPDFSPFLLYAYIVYNGAMQMGDLGMAEGTFTARTVVSTDKRGDIEQNMVASPQASSMLPPLAEFYLLADSLMQNPYEPVKLKNVFIDLKYTPGRNIATIEKVTPDRAVARPGETVTLAVKIRPYGKPVETKTVTVKVPEYTSEPVMAVVVAGGTNGLMLKPLTEPFPTTEEGVDGPIRWLTGLPSAQSMITVQAFPSPSYGYRGRMLRNLPEAVADLLRFGELGVGLPQGNVNRGNDEGEGGSNLQPTTYLSTEATPYVLMGGQAVMISIATEENAVQNQRRAGLEFGLNVPVLSSSVAPGREDGSEDNPSGRYEESTLSPWFTPQQRVAHSIILGTLRTPNNTPAPMSLPVFRTPRNAEESLLSTSVFSPRQGAEVEVDAAEGDGASGKPGTAENPKPTEGDDSDDEGNSDEEPEANTNKPSSSDKTLLSHRRFSWGLTGRNDFLRGKHLGTSVTSKGTLVLVPSARAIFKSAEMLPWKMVSTANGTYVAGWNSATVVRLTTGGSTEPFFPKAGDSFPNVESVTALATDAQGNLLVGTWPDQHVRLLAAADGTVLKDWHLPGASVWDVAVASNGVRYAACDQGALYILRDNADVPLQVGCTVPDKNVYALAAGLNGDIYLSTSPRGKVYRLTATGQLSSVYEARGSVTSLTVDKAGNLYVGTSPTCRIVRVSPDGTQQEIMRGMGRGNRHVLALQMLDDTLYAATGPAGGIYRIMHPTTADSEVSAVFAREDQGTGTGDQTHAGPESVMVNALAVSPQGRLLAAASSPSQVLELVPRTQGAFLSAVLQTPSVARWGQLVMHARIAEKEAVIVESRSGQTALPDTTWSQWQELSKDGATLTSPPATFAQFRVRMTGVPTNSPALEYVRVYFQPFNQPPALKLLEPKVGSYLNGKKQIRWEGRDPDGDDLVYTVSVSRDDGLTWKQLTPSKPEPKDNPAADNGKLTIKPTKGTVKGKPETAPPAPAPAKVSAEISETSIPWDTNMADDGTYRIKVVASDKYAKPMEAKTAEVISGRFVVDNSSPTVAVAEKVFGWEKLRRFEVIDNMTPIVGGKFRINDGPWTALVAEGGIFNSKRKWVLLTSPDGEIKLPFGEHKVSIQVEDSAGNVGDMAVTLVLSNKPAPQAKVDVAPIGDSDSRDLAELLLGTLR